ncbi:hypothetical protein P3S67_018899 [Capsicum chacoense]
MKKKNLDINEYPLCITLIPIEFPAGELSDSIQIVKENYFPTIEDDFCEEHLENEPKPIIMDPLYRDVEEGQLYWDKNTISSVMNIMQSDIYFNLRSIDHQHQGYYLQCANEKCQWTFRSSSQKESEVFMVTRFFDVHTCAIADRMLSQRHATSLNIVEMVKNKYLNLKSSFTPAEIMDEMRKSHRIRINYKKAYRIKAIELVRGSLLVDGTFLKSAYRGTILSASVLDAAGKILPLSYSIVDSENDASWECFFSKFKIAYGERENMSIVSDRYESILKVVAKENSRGIRRI